MSNWPICSGRKLIVNDEPLSLQTAYLPVELCSNLDRPVNLSHRTISKIRAGVGQTLSLSYESPAF